MRDAVYAGLRDQRVGRRGDGRRRGRNRHSALRDQRPRRAPRRAGVRVKELSAAAALPLPSVRRGSAAFARSAVSGTRWAVSGMRWFAASCKALRRAMGRAGRRGAALAGRGIRRLPLTAVALLVSAALAATAVVKFVVPAVAGIGSSGDGVALRQALLDNLMTLGSAGAAATGAGARNLPDGPADTWSRASYERYLVAAGDTLAALADRFGVTVDTIISFNDVQREGDLKPGRELIIPNQSGIRYTVRRGDDAGRIAARHGVSLSALLAVNGVEGALVAAGQNLLIPGAGLGENARNRVLGEIFIQPAPGRITSGYGYRSDPFTGLRKFHNGIDIANQPGTPIVAAMSGTVRTAGYNGNYGRYLILRHADGYQTLYAHLNKVLVAEGERVRQGQRVGEMGNTGYNSAFNLHFSIFLNGAHVDPSEHLE